MKKLLPIILAVFCCLGQQLYAQLEVIGSSEYGRIFDINYDPTTENTLYGITLGNHIVASHDNGINWSIFYSYPEPGTSLKTLRYLQGGKLSFYTNYGSTDKLCVLDLNTMTLNKQYTLPVPEGSDQNWISAYDFYQNNTDIAMVLQGFTIGMSNFAKVYYTENGGKNWQEVYYNVNYNDVFPNNVAISPANPQKLFIARGNGPGGIDGGLFISENAGTSWEEKIPGNTYQPITFNPENPDDILVGTSIGFGATTENIYRSLDGGDNWNIIPVTWTDQTLNNINAIVYNPSDLSNIIVLDENEIVITRDNFTTVENFVYPEVNTHSYYYGLTAAYNPFNGNEIFINADFHPLFSTDGGETLVQSKNPFFVTTGNVDISLNSEDHLYYGVQFGYVHRDLSTGIDTPYDIKPLDYMANDPGITTFADNSVSGRVYSFTSSFMGSSFSVSDDHGATKTLLLTLFANTLNTVTSDPENPDIIWAAFSNWGSEPQLYSIDISDINNIQSITIGLPEQDLVTGIIIDKADANKILMALGTKIFTSTDGGTTWTLSNQGLEELIPLQDLILKLVANPLNPHQFTIATNKGIFTSMDDGTSWTKIYNSLVHNVAHSTTQNGHIIAATHNSLISEFELVFSNDGGANWGKVPSQDLTYLASTTTAFNFDGDFAQVYIGAFDLGLVKYSVNINTVDIPVTALPQLNISLFPNPASETLTVKSNGTVAAVEIYNVTGQMVLSVKNTSSLNISNLESGIYLLKAMNTNGNSALMKFVKQ